MGLIKKADRIAMPWKNGGGTTFEIERVPQSADAYHWRLSQAVVSENGPFSMFPGYDRWIVVWEGAGFQLNQKVLRPFEPYLFKGEEAIQCSLLRGPVTDIGLIFNRAKVEAKMQMVSGNVPLPSGTHYVISPRDWIHERRMIDAGDTVRIEIGPTTKTRTVDVPSQSLLISVNRRAS